MSDPVPSVLAVAAARCAALPPPSENPPPRLADRRVPEIKRTIDEFKRQEAASQKDIVENRCFGEEGTWLQWGTEEEVVPHEVATEEVGCARWAFQNCQST